jgi:hypothetical protein
LVRYAAALTIEASQYTAYPSPETHNAMPASLQRALALPATFRARVDASTSGMTRVRAILLATLVIIVPGAWLAALLWLALRRVRAHAL